MNWIRTSPLDTPGFVGVVGGVDNSAGLFPEHGLAHYEIYGENPFQSIFTDRFGATWEVVMTSHSGEQFFTNVRRLIAANPAPCVEPDFYEVEQGGTIDTQLDDLASLIHNDFDLY